MAILQKTIKNAAALFSDQLWTLDTTNSTRSWKKIVRFVKLVRITFGTFAENRLGFQCVSLSYFVTLALVPLLAFIFAITGGLGLSDRIATLLYNILPSNPDLIDMLTDKAGNIINTAKSGAVGLISALTFLWAVIWMMFQVERVFNNVWGIRKIPRKIYKRFSYYLIVLILMPFIIIAFSFGIAFYTNLAGMLKFDFLELKFLPKFLGWIAGYAVSALTFSAMYKWIPSPKIRYKNCLKASLVSGLIFVIFQYLYLQTQVFVTRLNGVYGVMAAIPLFLIWLNFSWQIIIYGAVLTYSYENVDTYQISE